MKRVVITESDLVRRVQDVTSNFIYIGFEQGVPSVIFHRPRWQGGNYTPYCIERSFTEGNRYDGRMTLTEAIACWLACEGSREVLEFNTFVEAAKYIAENC